ncbi:hypothetical protein N9318_00005, partial [Euryarchaeota archaeon]|nr:hypothetical protein [Euryarchaeota archaeon]
MISRTSVSHVAFFIVSLFLLMPLLGIATSGVNDSPEELESPTNLSYTHTSSSMNEPGFQAGSIFNYETVIAGRSSVCAILDDESLYCWGFSNGGLGIGNQTQMNSPYPVSLGTGNTAISLAQMSGDEHTCIIIDNGSLNCWGRDQYGQVGNGNGSGTEYSPEHVDLGSGRTAVVAATGHHHSCAILDNGSVKCWGAPSSGQLGIPTISGNNYQYSPLSVDLGTGKTAVALALGDYFTCSILDDASLKCWGSNSDGQLGLGNSGSPDTDQYSPQSVNVGDNRTAVAISAGSSHTCTILDNGSLNCWGSNTWGQLGLGYTTSSSLGGVSTPQWVDLGSGRAAISVSAGYKHTCAILDNGSLNCWGKNTYGQLGIGSDYSTQTTPQHVNLGNDRTAKAVVTGEFHTCAILDDASLKCWGRGYYGALGLGTTTHHDSPQSVDLGTGRHMDLSERDIDGDGILNIFDTHMKKPNNSPISVSQHSCTVLDDGLAYCWGGNGYGQLGDGTTTSRNTPVAVNLPAGRTATSIASGTRHSCAILDDYSLYCWGGNNLGQIGDGTTIQRNNPTAVNLPSGRTVTNLSLGEYFSCAILDDYSMYCWGSNNYGQLGDGTTNDSSNPVAVALPSGRTARSSSGGNMHNCAILDNGLIYCWGANNYGQLGDGSNTNSFTTPVAVSLPSGLTAKSISAGYYHNCAILDNNLPYCWGRNSHGALGDGSVTNKNSPVTYTLPSGRTANFVSSGMSHTCVVLDNSSLYCSGLNSEGQLGNNDNSARTTAVAVILPSGLTASFVSAGTWSTCAIFDDGSEYCWGYGSGGRLGGGTSLSSPIPVAVSLPAGKVAMSMIDADLDGDGVVDTNDDYPSNPVRSISCPAGSYGRYVCIDSSAGHSAPTESMYDVECSAGTYQPSTGQASCIDASAGHYVLSTGSATQTICAAGTYQPSTGQTSCIDASAGYYVDGTGSTTQAACAAGTYNSNTASTSSSACTVASAGYYVADNSWTELLIDGDQSIASGQGHTCVILDDGSVSCWGYNFYGQLGDGTTNYRITPAQTASLGSGRTAVALSAGLWHTCAILDDGSVSCWGKNFRGQIGDGTNSHRYTPTQTASFGTGMTAVAISSGAEHTCAILNDGSVSCWGYNQWGQLGLGHPNDLNIPNQVNLSTGRTATALGTGWGHTCAVLDDGSVSCWGDNDKGQLGDGTTNDRWTPTQTASLGTGRAAVAISSGLSEHTCAILDDGSVSCWGSNQVGQLGDGTNTNRNSPTQTSSLGSGRTADAITTGGSTTCVILDNGSVSCWGGYVGDGTSADANTPTQTASLGSGRAAVAISAGQYHTCVILDNESVSCWGSNNYGELGDGTTNTAFSPTQTSSLGTGRTALVNSIFYPHTGQSSQTACTAGTYQPLIGQLSCINTSSGYYSIGTKSIVDLSSGVQHSCSAYENSSLYCWGRNDYGQLGDGTTTDSSTPVQVTLPIGRTAVSVSLGSTHSCAVLDDDSIYCWGENGYSQLGDGTTTDSSTPVQVNLPSGRTAVSVTTGSYHTCAILDDASLHCWGRNNFGQLGDGTTSSSSTPAQVSLPSGRTVISADAGSQYTCAILDNALMYCWGYNGQGQLGIGSTSSSSTPVQVSLPSGHTVTSISVGHALTCAILNDGSMYCWGYNNNGGVGDGTTTDRSSPVEVSLPISMTATSVSARTYHACAILDTSSLYCWGGNNGGALGNGVNYGQSTTPAQVISLSGSTVISVSTGDTHTCAVVATASPYCWGNNDYGQVGDGTTTKRNTPVNLDPPSSEIATSQIACLVGSYQPLTGQSSCVDASAGNYAYPTVQFLEDFEDGAVAGIWQTSSLATYPMTADSGSPISGSYSAMSTNQGVGGSASGIVISVTNMVNDTDTDGDGIADAASYSFAYSIASESNYDFLVFCIDNDANCLPSLNSPWTARWSGLQSGVWSDTVDAGAHTFTWIYWKNSNVNAFTDTAWIDDVTMSAPISTTQTACAAGTYQPSTGQSSCISADAGYYVPSTGSTTQTICAAGTYQPSTGQ